MLSYSLRIIANQYYVRPPIRETYTRKTHGKYRLNRIAKPNKMGLW